MNRRELESIFLVVGLRGKKEERKKKKRYLLVNVFVRSSCAEYSAKFLSEIQLRMKKSEAKC